MATIRLLPSSPVLQPGLPQHAVLRDGHPLPLTGTQPRYHGDDLSGGVNIGADGRQRVSVLCTPERVRGEEKPVFPDHR